MSTARVCLYGGRSAPETGATLQRWWKRLQVVTTGNNCALQAGARIAEVVEQLRPHGLTLQNIASIREQAMGGFLQACEASSLADAVCSCFVCLVQRLAGTCAAFPCILALCLLPACGVSVMVKRFAGSVLHFHARWHLVCHLLAVCLSWSKAFPGLRCNLKHFGNGFAAADCFVRRCRWAHTELAPLCHPWTSRWWLSLWSRPAVELCTSASAPDLRLTCRAHCVPPVPVLDGACEDLHGLRFSQLDSWSVSFAVVCWALPVMQLVRSMCVTGREHDICSRSDRTNPVRCVQ